MIDLLSEIHNKAIIQGVIVLNQTDIVSNNRWSVLFWNTIAYLYDSLALITLSICIPFIIKEMNISLSQSGLLSSATMIGGLSALYFLGKWLTNLVIKKLLFGH